jgi:hypothetical protein
MSNVKQEQNESRTWGQTPQMQSSPGGLAPEVCWTGFSVRSGHDRDVLTVRLIVHLEGHVRTVPHLIPIQGVNVPTRMIRGVLHVSQVACRSRGVGRRRQATGVCHDYIVGRLMCNAMAMDNTLA